MDKLIIEGPVQLKGKVSISASKNATLPILAACILNPNKIEFRNLPELADVKTMLRLIGNLGGVIDTANGYTSVNTKTLNGHQATYDLVKTMRASILVLGPLLARFGKATVSLPGGCAIGARPIDIHLQGLEKLGATIRLKSGYVEVEADELIGNEITLPFPSVGATENLMMAGVLAKGVTYINNAAMEPEIIDLANFLGKMGFFVQGAGTNCIKIEGTTLDKAHGTQYTIIPDRIEAATFLIGAVMTNSEILIENIEFDHIRSVIDVLENMGAKFELGKNTIKTFHWKKLKGVQVDTAPYPGVATDVQAQLMAMTLCADGISVITEHIFENRFMHVSELNRMGANIVLRGNTAIMNGPCHLTAAPVMCTDLRASAALVLSALISNGKSEIQRIYHLDRGYEKLEEKFRNLGVNIARVKGNNL